METEMLIVCKNNTKIQVNKQLKPFIIVWDQIFDEDDEDIVDFEANPQLIKEIDYYYQLHNYNKDSIMYSSRIEQIEIQKNMDEYSLIFLKQYGYDESQDSIEWVKDWMIKINPLLNECYRLNCIELIEVLLLSIAIKFYIEGITEKEFQLFSQKWQIQYPLPPLRQRQIVEDNKLVFDRLTKK